MAATPEQIAAAKAAGFSTPVGTDLISGGDNAISNNAGTAYAMLMETNFDRHTVPRGTNMNDTRTRGLHTVETSGDAATLINWPFGSYPGWALVFEAENGTLLQIAFCSTYSQRKWVQRQITSVTSGNFSAWETVWDPNAPAAETDVVPAFKHVDLLSRAKARRHGIMGTSGLPVVSLRFDHHLEPFRDKILPLLIERKLPFCLALNPENTANTTKDDNVPWATIQAWCIQNGGEVINHGGNHGNATTKEQLRTQIVGSLASLETNLPALSIEGWAPPGLTDGQYMGASPFKTVAQNSETYAGQLITGNHAFVAGYAPGVYRTLAGNGTIGAPHVTMDKASLSNVVSALNAVQENAEGVAFMLHPNYLDQPDYMTTATLVQILDEIAARRDAGQLEVLSYTSLWVADSSTEQRNSLVKLTAPFTLSSTYTASWNPYRREQLLGGMREIRAKITGTGSHRVKVAGGAVYSLDNKTGTSLIRVPFTIPLDQTEPLVFTVESSNIAAVLESFKVVAI